MIDAKDVNFDLIVEENPEIGKYLSLMWGKPEFVHYIHTLTNVSPAANNDKFSPAMSLALFEIAAKHSSLYTKLYR